MRAAAEMRERLAMLNVTKVLDQIDRGERDADLAEMLAALKAEQEAGSKTLRPA